MPLQVCRHPTVVGYTRRILLTGRILTARCPFSIWSYKRVFSLVGYGYGLFTGGLGLHYGVEHLGGTVIDVTGNTDKHILARDFGATVIACTPFMLIFCIDLRQKVLSKDDFKLRIGNFWRGALD